jgi:hypothetical protein
MNDSGVNGTKFAGVLSRSCSNLELGPPISRSIALAAGRATRLHTPRYGCWRDLAHTQPQRPVSGFAIATLVLGIIGIVLPAVICGIVALGQIRGGSYSGRGMVIAGLLISAAWVLLVAAFAAYVVITWPG